MNSSYDFRLILTYFTFRLLLAAGLFTLSLTDSPLHSSGTYHSQDFLIASSSYLFLTLAMQLYMLAKAHTPNRQSVFFAIIIDVVFCLLFLHFAGGFGTGLAILLLLPIVIAGIFFYGIFAFFIAAISSVGILSHIAWTSLQHPDQSKYFVPAGLLGGLFFALSFATQLIAKHIRKTEEIVSQQQNLSFKLEQINQRIIQKMQTGVILVNQQGQVLMINDSAQHLLNNQSQVHAPLPNALKHALEKWQQQPKQFSTTLSLQAGMPLLHINFSSVQPDNKNSDIILFIQDQSRLTQQAQHLKLASLGRLSANIAHEIRNPLSAINHASQLLAEDSSFEESDKRLLNIITNHVARLNNIIDNVLSISSRQAANIDKIYLRTVIEKAIEQVEQSKAVELNHQFEFSDNPLVPFDEGQLLQVLTILIDNAIIHRNQEQELQLVFRYQILDGKVVLQIVDNNPNIAPEELEKIFEPFYTTSKNGTGLGLYICRELCEMNQAWLSYVGSEHEQGYFQIRFAHIEKHLS